MTICIGVLCADNQGQESKVAIVASDRMVTFGGLTEFEHEIPKTSKVTDRIVVLTSGDALRGARLVREVRSETPGGTVVVREVTDALASRYGELRRNQIDADIFRPRGISMEQFYGGLSNRMLGPIAGGLEEQVARFEYGVELLVAGTDDGGAHLYSLSNPGDSFAEFHQIGFHAIGSGMLHALQSIIGFKHTGRKPILEALFTVYASKRRAEVAPGVGADTDIAIISNTGIRWLKETEISHLRKIFEDYQRPVTEEMKKELEMLDTLDVGKEGGDKK